MLPLHPRIGSNRMTDKPSPSKPARPSVVFTDDGLTTRHIVGGIQAGLTTSHLKQEMVAKALTVAHLAGRLTPASVQEPTVATPVVSAQAPFAPAKPSKD